MQNPPNGSSRWRAYLCPELEALCRQFILNCAHAGLRVIITQTYRSSEQQAIDYAQGRTTPGKIITNAKPGESKHNCEDRGVPAARAFDFAIYAGDGNLLDWNAEDDNWKTAIKIGEDLGLVSGSTWHCIKDSPHMELPD